MGSALDFSYSAPQCSATALRFKGATRIFELMMMVRKNNDNSHHHNHSHNNSPSCICRVVFACRRISHSLHLIRGTWCSLCRVGEASSGRTPTSLCFWPIAWRRGGRPGAQQWITRMEKTATKPCQGMRSSRNNKAFQEWWLWHYCMWLQNKD